MSHTRLVHFHQATDKVVCCRPGEEVLYPSASTFITDWTHPVEDRYRIGTHRFPLEWPDLQSRFPHHRPVSAGNWSTDEEANVRIHPEVRLPLQPVRLGLKVDVCLGVRHRINNCEDRNWRHWGELASTLRARGLAVAVIGRRETSVELPGVEHHSGDFPDTDAAVELLQGCRLFIGTDSGTSHLAALCGARMLIFRATRMGSRDFTPHMRAVNAGRVDVLSADAWDNPSLVINAAAMVLSPEH